MMVTLGACAFLIMGVEILASYSRDYQTQLDPTRVLQGVVGGIGFLGAGSIIQSRGNVEGITTAATVWVAGAIGAGCGLGHFVLVGILVTFALVTLWGLGKMAVRLLDRSTTRILSPTGWGKSSWQVEPKHRKSSALTIPSSPAASFRLIPS